MSHAGPRAPPPSLTPRRASPSRLASPNSGATSPAASPTSPMVAALAEVARAAQHAHASPTNRPSPLRAATPRAAAAAAAAATHHASPAHHASPVSRAAPDHSREWWDTPAHHSCRPSEILLPTPSPSRAVLAASRSSPPGYGALKPQQGQRRAASRAAPPSASPPPASPPPAAAAERRRSSSSAALRLATGEQLRLAPRDYGELAQATALRHANASPKAAWAEGAGDSHAWPEEPRRTAAPPAGADAAADAAAAAYTALCARFGGDLSAAHLASLPREQVRALSAELQRTSGCSW